MGRLAPAVACGAAGAALYLALTLGTPGALLLAYLTQLPLFVAGLWLGTGAAAVAGLTATVVLVAASDVLGAALFALLNAAPVVLLVRQALLARPRPDGTLAWYPPGLLAAWLTATTLGGMALALVVFGGPQGLQAALREIVGGALDRLARQPIADRGEAAELLAMIVPGLIAASWMISSVINAALAQGLLARFGANWRPSPDLGGLGLPLWLPVALGLAAAATIFGGTPRYLGVNALIALTVPFGLAGLAVLHMAARRLPHPATALVAFYALAVVFGWPFLAVALLGLLEYWLGLRRRLAPQGVTLDG